MKYKFENLEVWKLSIQLQDTVYEIVEMLPDIEKFNLVSQMRRASTSVSLNIAEGSTSVSNAEQLRFLSYSIRSLVEVIACLRIIEHRNYVNNPILINQMERVIDLLFIKLQAFRKSLK